MKIKKGLPVTVSLFSLCCGFASILCTIEREYDIAAWLIILSMIFDSVDGKLARFTRTSSAFGCQFDSLVDVIAFGVAPVVMVGCMFKEMYPIFIYVLCFFFLACTALRLARFNIQSSPENTPCKYYVGLPTTVSGGTIAQLVLLHDYLNSHLGITTVQTIIPSVIFVLGVLMISKVKFFNIMSRIGIKQQGVFPFGLEVACAIALFVINPRIALSVSLSAYIVVCGLLGLVKGTGSRMSSRRERNHEMPKTLTTLKH